MEEEVPAICIDIGTGTCKAGFAGDEAPRCVFPTLIGRSKVQSNLQDQQEGSVFVGRDATSRRNGLHLSQPLENGIITNWDDMEKIWHYTLHNELKVNPEEHPIILTEPALNPKQNREHITKIMFEKFNIPCLYVCMQEVCALYASGRTTGVVLDSGEGTTHAVPIFEGFAVPNTI